MTERILEGAKLYALADSSDPFVYQRCMTHIRQGLCRPLQDGSDGHYTATPYPEARKTVTGEAYMVTVYKNVARP